MYIEEIKNKCKWCDDNHLYLNVSEMKEMCTDFRKSKSDSKPVWMKQITVVNHS